MLSALRRALVPARSVAEAVGTQARMYHENVRLNPFKIIFSAFWFVCACLRCVAAQCFATTSTSGVNLKACR